MTLARDAIRTMIPLLGAFVAVAQSGDVYVDNRLGLDSNLGASPVQIGPNDGPVRTVSAGFRRVGPGSKVILLPTGAPYYESAVIDGSIAQGRAGLPIVLEGNGVELVGARPVAKETWDHHRDLVYVTKPTSIFRGRLWIDGRPGHGLSESSYGSNPPSSLKPQEYSFLDGRLYMGVDSNRFPQSYDVQLSRLRTGLFVYRADNIVIRNLRIWGFAGDGLQVRGPANGVRLENCEIRDNSGAGVSGVNCSNVSMQRCVVRNNAVGALAVNRFSKWNVSDTALLDPKKTLNDGTATAQESGTPVKEWAPSEMVVPEIFLSRRRRPEPRDLEPPKSSTERSADESSNTQSLEGKPESDSEPAMKDGSTLDEKPAKKQKTAGDTKPTGARKTSTEKDSEPKPKAIKKSFLND